METSACRKRAFEWARWFKEARESVYRREESLVISRIDAKSTVCGHWSRLNVDVLSDELNINTATLHKMIWTSERFTQRCSHPWTRTNAKIDLREFVARHSDWLQRLVESRSHCRWDLDIWVWIRDPQTKSAVEKSGKRPTRIMAMLIVFFDIRDIVNMFLSARQWLDGFILAPCSDCEPTFSVCGTKKKFQRCHTHPLAPILPPKFFFAPQWNSWRLTRGQGSNFEGCLHSWSQLCNRYVESGWDY